MSRKRDRDHKKEYRRKLQLRELREQQLAAPPKPRHKKKRLTKQQRNLANLKRRVKYDASRTFGTKPKRGKGEGSRYDPSPFVRIDYAEVLARKLRRNPKFDWTNEDEFIGALTDMGMPTQEAYTLWFSP